MSFSNQQGDVLLYQTVDDGEMNVELGVTEMTGGFQTAIYLSFFGGNEDDSGQEVDKLKQYWQNHIETVPARKLRSETQHIIDSLPATSGNLKLIEAAMIKDLDWMQDSTSLIEVAATLPSRNRVDLFANIEADGVREEFKYSANWEAM